MDKACGIYEIKCLGNGKSYIGSSTELARRLRVHKWALRERRHINPKLQTAWNKYGEASFEFRILILCQPETRLFYEQSAIAMFDAVDAGLNVARSVSSPALGVPHSVEAKRKISEASKGRRHSEATREVLRAAGLVRSAVVSAQMKEHWRTRSRAIIEKIAAANTGKKRDAEAREMISRSSLEKWRRPEFREAMLDTLVRAREAAFSPEGRAKMSETMKRRMADPAEKAKISAVHTGRKNTEETKEKMRRAALAREERKRLATASKIPD